MITIDIDVTRKSGSSVLQLEIVPHFILHPDHGNGPYWTAGVAPIPDLDDDIEDEWIAYGINEGETESEFWDFDEYDVYIDDSLTSWRVRPEGVALLKRHSILK